ncbi:MAG: esterase family protein, partial [bacterium]|nr:esterase family protein [bacterium]
MTRSLFLLVVIACACFGQDKDRNRYYQLGPDSLPREGVPKGRMHGPFVLPYMHPEGDIRAQNVMDNLIYRREIPVMLGIFFNPGRRPDQPMATLKSWGDRTSNRPEEYNSLDDRYARVIVDELLPVLQKQYNISPDPEHRGIGGSSSGAIAAFTVAWERPNEFRKILSLIGTYVNLRGRGGSRYPDLIRDTPNK